MKKLFPFMITVITQISMLCSRMAGLAKDTVPSLS